jgi:ubiquinol-cytochrome c reductase cytochrome b subunit
VARRPDLLARLAEALDSRLGTRAILRGVLEEPVPGGARFVFSPGSALVALLASQLVTGVALAFSYSPSTASAWASVLYLEQEVPAGALLRGLHHFGASALIVVLGAHLIQTALFGAYRPPRELVWWSGLLLGGLLFAFALTGYLLPWDQKGYWATRVATGIAGGVPWIGPPLERLLVGGNGYGNLTLTRFYALHALVLPTLLLGILGLHLLAFRRHGVTPRWDHLPGQRIGRFWPEQLWRNALVSAAVIGVVFGLALRYGAPLSAPADPNGDYPPRPEWYFLPLFQLLKYFEGRWIPVATLVIPGLVLLFLGGLPFLDRASSRRPLARALPLLGLFVILGGAGTLGLLAARADARDPAFQRAQARAEDDARRIQSLARAGVPPEGPEALWARDPIHRGRQIFEQQCRACHAPPVGQPRKAPSLEGYLSRDWLVRLLRDPDAPEFFGGTKAAGLMEGYAQLGDSKLQSLADFLRALGDHDVAPDQLPGELQPGRRLFEGEGCDACHSLRPGDASPGPNLAGYGGARWLTGFLENPASPLYFGDTSSMTVFGSRLTAEDRRALIAFLR